MSIPKGLFPVEKYKKIKISMLGEPSGYCSGKTYYRSTMSWENDPKLFARKYIPEDWYKPPVSAYRVTH